MNNRQKGILCILASAMGFAAMALFVRLCDSFGGEVSSFQKSFFRNAVALIIAAGVFSKNPRIFRGDIPGRSLGAVALPLLARGVFGTIGIFANFYALSHIQIGEAMTLNKTAPFFTVLFSWLLMGERLSLRQALWLMLAFAGAMLVMKPGFRGTDAFPALCALAGGLGAGVAYVCVHRLGRLDVDSAFVVLFFSAFSCLASLPFVLLDFCPMTSAQILIMLGAGAGAAVGQFGVTAAYRLAEPRSIAVFDYMNVVFTALLGLCFFGQIPDLLSVAGFVLILSAAIRMCSAGGRGGNAVH